MKIIFNESKNFFVGENDEIIQGKFQLISLSANFIFMKIIYSFLFFTLVSFLIGNTEATDRPNVIFVLADDLGIGDVSPTNKECKIKTPHLQKMADEGITFHDAHTSSSVCTHRYGVLTGRYNWRSRLARGVLGGTSKHLIPANRATVGHLLKKAGYHTQMIGKWHLGWDWDRTGKGWQKHRFFQAGQKWSGYQWVYQLLWTLWFPGYASYVWVDTGRPTAIPNREEGVHKNKDPYGWYRNGPIAPDFEIDQVLPHLFDKSIAYIKERANDNKPFFLYLPLPLRILRLCLFLLSKE